MGRFAGSQCDTVASLYRLNTLRSAAIFDFFALKVGVFLWSHLVPSAK